MPKIRLLLLDDHALFRESLGRLLADDPEFEVVARCESPEDALVELAGDGIDLVLLDYDLGSETGLQFVRKARAAGYGRRIFLVTAGVSDADCVRALGLGVCGIFLKHSPPEQLSDAIRRVMAGETWIDPRCIRTLTAAVSGASPGGVRENRLTGRERDVLRGVFDGQSNKEIAVALKISEPAVKSALQQLFLKTGVRTRSQLVRVALEKYASEWHQPS